MLKITPKQLVEHKAVQLRPIQKLHPYVVLEGTLDATKEERLKTNAATNLSIYKSDLPARYTGSIVSHSL